MHRNSEAAAIHALPHRHHPRLARLTGLLAAKPGLSVGEARDILDAACQAAGISLLDVEMMHPAADTSVPFAPVRQASPGSDFKEGVAAHLAQIIEARR